MRAARLSEDLASWASWPCPGCEASLTAPDIPADLRCRECSGKVPQRSRAEVLRSAGVPGRFRESFDDLESWPRDPRDGRDVDLRSWDGQWSSVTILGAVGAGKTMLATELLWRLSESRSILWIRGDRLVRHVFGGDQWLRRRVSHAGALVLDDLGRGMSDPAWSLLDDVIADRHESMRATIVTSNLSMVQMMESRPAIADRLRQGILVKMAGESRR